MPASAPAPKATRDTHIFVGRQPILDTGHAVIGYELLFRDGPDAQSADITSAASATAQVICTAFTELGMAEALKNLKVFINVDGDFLASDALELLPTGQVVLELDATGADATLIDRCRDLSLRGYALSVNVDAAKPLDVPALIELADYIKLDIGAAAPATTAAAIRQFGPTHARKLLAAKVETAGQADWCAKEGFNYFQGYFFARPVIVEGRKLDPTTHGLFRIINLVSGDGETHDIENAFKTDPALTMNLLRLVNSAALGMRSRVGSIAQAITLLGRRQLLRWLQLLLFRGGGDGTLTANPLMLHAALRGRFMELLVQRRYPGQRAMLDSAFIVGVMSMMPAALGMPMKEVLEQIDIAADIRDAASNYGGELGRLLLLTEYFDDNNPVGCAVSMQEIGELNQHILNTCLAEVLTWIQSFDF